MKTALGALQIAVRNALLSGSPAWADRVYPVRARSGTVKPYAVFFFMGGGETNERKIQDATLVLGVKCVAESYTTAEAGAAEIAVRLNNKGLNDVASGYLDSTDWHIMTSTQELAIEVLEEVDNKDVWHEGHQYRFVMEAK